MRDEQWQALFRQGLRQPLIWRIDLSGPRHYPTVGHAFFSSAATADGGGKKTIHWAVLNMKHPKLLHMASSCVPHSTCLQLYTRISSATLE